MPLLILEAVEGVADIFAGLGLAVELDQAPLVWVVRCRSHDAALEQIAMLMSSDVHAPLALVFMKMMRAVAPMGVTEVAAKRCRPKTDLKYLRSIVLVARELPFA